MYNEKLFESLEIMEREEFARLSKIQNKTPEQLKEFEYLKEKYLKDIKNDLANIDGTEIKI